ncbi:hypothetical protein Pcinc_035285 [Petrolisthes cinctipes]|uniref:Uncharacterized protein n=1 Tax=Petrolisthes cinctipes TaxID=88211 RepID=A0AAE1BWV0_PETCI|nr:hypothetical protein Pcinc_035285 [Petrolisthes cinctipes]
MHLQLEARNVMLWDNVAIWVVKVGVVVGESRCVVVKVGVWVVQVVVWVVQVTAWTAGRDRWLTTLPLSNTNKSVLAKTHIEAARERTNEATTDGLKWCLKAAHRTRDACRKR